MIRFRLKELVADWEYTHSQRLTLGKLSKETGISRITLSKIANSRDYSTSTDIIDKICGFFDCGVGDVMEHIPEAKAGESSEEVERKS